MEWESSWFKDNSKWILPLCLGVFLGGVIGEFIVFGYVLNEFPVNESSNLYSIDMMQTGEPYFYCESIYQLSNPNYYCCKTNSIHNKNMSFREMCFEVSSNMEESTITKQAKEGVEK